MLIVGVWSIVLLASTGSALTNYAWHEAQAEELRSALRASVSAAGPLLSGAGGPMNSAIEERVGKFLQASMPGLDIGRVTVEYDPDTGVISVSVDGVFAFQDLWETGSDDAEAIRESVNVRHEFDRYETAVALDLSASMEGRIPTGNPGETIRKIEGLKNAMRTVLQIVGEASRNDPGSIMVSVVPFGAAVNVADTCNPHPDTGACRSAQSAGKERYLRMLVGPHPTTDSLLAAARGRGNHWVDTFHNYGAGSNLGPLRSQSLPQGLLDGLDWNLRREGVRIDVSAQAPRLDAGAGQGVWVVNHEDFWNGCVMARWGAYWDEDARPPGWNPGDIAHHWPATQAVPGWARAAGLAADTPLHLSDAPPEAGAPSTLFTAFSWPDARIGKTADHQLQNVMLDLLGETSFYASLPSQADNDWSVSEDRGGASLCPPSPIAPLTDDVAQLQVTIERLATIPRHGSGGMSANYLHLGVVWGLRTVSPLWRETWQIVDPAARPRPGTPCAPGDGASGCDTDLNKSILLVSDGANDAGGVFTRMLLSPFSGNPYHGSPAMSECTSSRGVPEYRGASQERSEAAFNSRFSPWVAADGTFDSSRAHEVVATFESYLGPVFSMRRDRRIAALTASTPWQLFRGIDEAGAIDRLLDPANGFQMRGRPTQIHHFCGRSSAFGAYGRVDDAIRVGESGTLPVTLLDPVYGAAPFMASSDAADADQVERQLDVQLNDWLYEACELARQRRVRVNAIYMGSPTGVGRAVLRECVHRAGGDPERDVYFTPTASELEGAFREIFTVRRNLRFLN